MISEYKESRQYMDEDIEESLNFLHFNKNATIAYLIDQWDSAIDEGGAQKCAVYIPLGYLALTTRRTTEGIKNKIKSNLMDIDMEAVKESVSAEEYEEISNSIDEILSKIDNVEISKLVGGAYWEYEEMNEEVEKYIDTLEIDKNTISETVRLTLERFKSSCIFNKSEEICVYVTLAERLLGYVDDEGIEDYNKLIEFIKAFDVRSIEDEQFTESEKEDLVGRINKIIDDTKGLGK